MTEDAERWKEKYLKSIEQQEKLERRWDARLDLLRRGLVRSTLAAEGSDKVVDACMKEMREVIRSDNMDAGLAGLIPRLEKAVLDSEQRRETRMNQVSDALTALVGQLQGLPLPSEISRPLKKLAKKTRWWRCPVPRTAASVGRAEWLAGPCTVGPWQTGGRSPARLFATFVRQP